LTTSVGLRLTNDPSAPSLYSTDRDETHPFRMKDVIGRINAKLPSEVQINQYDILVIRRVHKIEENIEFFHEPKYSSPQYSELFVEWVVERYREDPDFFAMTRREYKKAR
jgi:hypothetical protein